MVSVCCDLGRLYLCHHNCLSVHDYFWYGELHFNIKLNKYPMSLCICHHRRIGSDLLLVNLTHAGRSFRLQWLGEEVFRRWRHYYSQPAQPLSKAHPSQFEVPKMFPASFIKGKIAGCCGSCWWWQGLSEATLERRVQRLNWKAWREGLKERMQEITATQVALVLMMGVT